MYIAISLVLLTILTIIVFMRQPKFGKNPSGERLARIKKSPNYVKDSFQNKNNTPVLSEDVNFFSVAGNFILSKRIRIKPTDKIPSVKTDLLNLDRDKDILIWFGHSSYFIQLDGKKILVDPVLSNHASPFSFSIKAFNGTTIYTADDIPEIDYLFITHDHWDHLDYETIRKLKPKIKKVICGLGTGSHFEHWGFSNEIIIEMDWNEQVILDSNFTVTSIPSKHFSGRTFKRNQTLWTSFVLQTPTMKLFLGSDGGYDTHFEEAGKTFGTIDFAIIENGQYNKNWKHIHMSPDESVKACKDLNAKQLFVIHSSKFALSTHSWDEPLIKVSALSKALNIPLITPMIGEQVNLKDKSQQFSEWWKDVY